MRLSSLTLTLLLSVATLCLGQQGAHTYRGKIGQQSVVVKLQRAGDKLTGSYVYERIGQSITLKGQIDAQGQVTLQEFDATGRPTGKFNGKLGTDEGAEDFALSGTWTRPDGSHETYFSLVEQHVAFADAKLQIVPKTIAERRFHISATYPQLAGSSAPGALAFNRAAAGLVTKMAAEFRANVEQSDRIGLETDYNVLFASDALISVEITNFTDFGGAHPSSGYNALNYDLRTGRPLALAALFKRGVKFELVLQRAAAANLQAQMKRVAAANNEAPDETIFGDDSGGDWHAWGLTPRGLVVYYDLPHVMSVFDKVFIPWAELQDILDPKGPAARFAPRK
jgi:hypothetical protein